MKYKITLTFDVNEEEAHLNGEIRDDKGKLLESMEPWVMAVLSLNLHDTANRWLERGLQTGIIPRQ